MLPLCKTTYQSNSQTGESLLAFLKRSPLLYVLEKDGVVTMTRLRALPSRGFFRLLIPRLVSRVRTNPRGLSVTYKLDTPALIMLIILLGATVVELTMSRDLYPREYPPEFIIGLAGVYVLAVVYDVLVTKRVVKQILGA